MTALLFLVPLPILMLVVLADHFAKRKGAWILSKLAFTLAVCAEVPMMVWVYRSVADESLALYIAYGGAILTVYAEYWLTQVFIDWVLRRFNRQGTTQGA